MCCACSAVVEACRLTLIQVSRFHTSAVSCDTRKTSQGIRKTRYHGKAQAAVVIICSHSLLSK